MSDKLPPIKLDASGRVIGLGGAITEESEIKQDLPISRENIDRLKSILTILGGVGGGILGTPLVGGTIGTLAGSTVGNIGEELLTREPKDISAVRPLINAIPEAGLQIGLEGAGRFLGAPLARMKNALLRRSFPVSRIPEDIEATLNYANELKPTYGQVTGSKFAGFMENALASGAKKERELTQQETISDLLTRERQTLSGATTERAIPQRVFGWRGQRVLEPKFWEMKGRERIAWEEVGQHAKDNSIPIKKVVGHQPTGLPDPLNPGKEIMIPIVEDAEVIGPITTTKAVSKAMEFKPVLDRFVSSDRFTRLPADMQAKYAGAKEAVDDLVSGTRIMLPDGTEKIIYAKNYETVKDFRTRVANIVGDDLFIDREKGQLKALAKQLGDDIDSSIAGWNRGPEALKAIRKANRTTEELHSIFTDRVEAALKGDKSQFLTEAYENRDAAREMMRALGSDESRIYKSGYFEKLIADNTDVTSKTFNVRKAIDSLTHPDSPAMEFFNGKERQRLVKLFRAIKTVGEKEQGSGVVALKIREGGMALSVSGGLISGALKGNLPAGAIVGGTGLAVIFRARHFANKVLLNPNYATLANRLAKLPPMSDEAKSASKKLLMLMRGTEVVLGMPGGVRIDGYIDNSGKFKADFQAESQYKETHTPQGIKLTPR